MLYIGGLIGFVISTIIYMFFFKKEQKRTIQYLKKYYFVLKFSIKNLEYEKYNNLLDELKKEFGE